MSDENTEISGGASSNGNQVEEIENVAGEAGGEDTSESQKKGGASAEDETAEKEDTSQVDEEPLEDKVPEPPIITLDKLATTLLIGAVCLVFNCLISTIGIRHSWLLAFTLWIASSIAYIAISSKKVLPCGKSVLITGCDTGFGHSLALHLEKLGFRVFALCLKDGDGASKLRSIESKHMHVIIGDVTNDEDMKNARKEVDEHLPKGEGLWSLVNNAGIMAFGDVEWVPMSIYKKVTDVNVFGMINATKTFLPLVRKAKGRVINMSSMFGRMPAPIFSPYVLSKFAVEGFSDCLRFEMQRWDVNVILVEPGNFTAGTNLFTEESVKQNGKEMWDSMSEEVRSDYGEDQFKKRLAILKSYTAIGSTDISQVILTIVDALTDARPQVRYQPMDLYFKTRVFAASHLPEWLYGHLYAKSFNKQMALEN